jgi:Holliday junction DNA helicase RuvB
MMSAVATIHTATLPSLDDVIGQSAAVERLKVAVAAAKADDRPLDHLLLTGAGGTGKTALTQIVASSMNVPFKESLASALNDGGMAAFLLDATDKQILFVDEVHELASEQMTLCYRAMAERKLFLPSTKKARSLPLTAFTLVAATTNPEHLPPSFKDRFTEIALDFYTADELAAIVAQRAASMGWHAEPGVFELIGRLGRGVPRLAIRLLSACREVCRSRNQNLMTVEHCKTACKLEGKDCVLGLDRTERHLLTILDEAGGPVRLGVIASRLGRSPATVADAEGFLLRSGLILRCEQGRTITPEGIEYLRHGVVAGPTCCK